MARYVAMGEAEPGTVAELIGSALTTLERTQEGAEAVVDAVWSHDVSMAVCVTFFPNHINLQNHRYRLVRSRSSLRGGT